MKVYLDSKFSQVSIRTCIGVYVVIVLVALVLTPSQSLFDAFYLHLKRDNVSPNFVLDFRKGKTKKKWCQSSMRFTKICYLPSKTMPSFRRAKVSIFSNIDSELFVR